MKKFCIHSINFILIMVILFGFSIELVSADAWWGEGYRKPQWVRANGGTTISYTIKGTNHENKYKAMMFRDGKYVEVEFGKKATFDDARNGVYTINFYKCKNCKKHKFNNKTRLRDRDKKVASITLVARPGEANVLIFNAANNTVKLVSNSGGISKLNKFDQQKRIAKNNTGKLCKYQNKIKEKTVFENLFFLSRKINHNLFLDENIDMGIFPKFLVKK